MLMPRELSFAHTYTRELNIREQKRILTTLINNRKNIYQDAFATNISYVYILMLHIYSF